MKTKLSIFIFLLLMGGTSLHGQITVGHNGLRPGDSLIKQQVGYKNPGDAGADKIWNFSILTLMNDRYSVNYDFPPENDSLYFVGERYFDKRELGTDQLIMGTEHNTVYFYRMNNKGLVLLGHENPVVRLGYADSLPVLRFPFNYGDIDSTEYLSDALYSGTIPVQAKGYIVTKADAYGKMLLPDDVVLDTVLRVKTTQVINNTPVGFNLEKAGQRTTTETYRWYLKGYRYPVFETIKGLDENGKELFATAFYFPLQDHLYLEDDPENEDKLWDIAQTKSKTGLQGAFSKPRYQCYPNPVGNLLHINLTLDIPTDVDILLYSAGGKIYKKLHLDKQVGIHHEAVDCSMMPTGIYLLKLILGTETASEVIIKK